MASSIRYLSILVLFIAIFIIPAYATTPVTPVTPGTNGDNDDDEWTTYVLAALVGIMGLLLLLGLLALVLIRSQSDNYDDVGYRGISLPYATRSGNGYAPINPSQAMSVPAGGLPPVLTPPTPAQTGLEGPSLMPPMAGPSSSVEAPPMHSYHKDAFYHV